MKTAFAFLSAIAFSVTTGQAFAYCIATNTNTCPQTTNGGWPNSTARFHSHGLSGSNSTFNNAFTNALYSWNNKSRFNYTATAGSADPCDPGYTTRGWTFDSTYCGTTFGAATLAVTLTFASTYTPAVGTIADANIIFNSSKAWGVHASGISAATVDFQRVAAHELGHALGLGHDDTRSALMNTFYGNLRAPATDDINGLVAIYGNIPSSSPSSNSMAAIFQLMLLDEDPGEPEE